MTISYSNFFDTEENTYLPYGFPVTGSFTIIFY